MGAVLKKIRLWGIVWAVIAMAGPMRGEEIKLWPDGAPGARGTEKNDTPTLQLFPLPWEMNGPVPAVLLIPGGGYKHISGYDTFRDFFRTRPVRFFSMKDHAHGPSVARLLGPNPGATLIDDLSKELQVTAKTPPTFLAHAKDDGLVPPENSMMYHEALKRAGVATTLKLYKQGGHDVTSKPNPWKADLGDWMSEMGILPEGVARPLPGAAKLYKPTTDYTVNY